jgi:hypothetical protein
MSKRREQSAINLPELERYAQEYEVSQARTWMGIDAGIAAAAAIGGIELIKSSIDNLGNPLSLFGIGVGVVFLAAAVRYGQDFVDMSRRFLRAKAAL